MLPDSAHRVESNTPTSLNERIRRDTELSVSRTLALGRAAIDERLKALDREWDTERVLEALAASFTLSGLALGLTVSRKWFALPAVVAGFLLQHATQGFCPPLLVLRAGGVRTRDEIDHERYALKAARGDFAVLDASKPSALALLAAARR
jgi:hypothetical protein